LATSRNTNGAQKKKAALSRRVVTRQEEALAATLVILLQANEGESLDVQRRQIKGYADMHGLPIDEIVVEQGVSEQVELIPHEGEQEAIREIVPLRAQGKALRAIAHAVRAKGHQISHEGVAGVLRAQAWLRGGKCAAKQVATFSGVPGNGERGLGCAVLPTAKAPTRRRLTEPRRTVRGTNESRPFRLLFPRRCVANGRIAPLQGSLWEGPESAP
jgi:hypothetical protein